MDVFNVVNPTLERLDCCTYRVVETTLHLNEADLQILFYLLVLQSDALCPQKYFFEGKVPEIILDLLVTLHHRSLLLDILKEVKQVLHVTC